MLINRKHFTKFAKFNFTQRLNFVVFDHNYILYKENKGIQQIKTKFLINLA